MDILVVWDAVNGRGDWAFANGGLAIDEGGLLSAVLVSLFTDARAPDDYTLPGGGKDRRGWWADTYQADDTGSLLWLLARAKKAGNGQGYTGSNGSLLQQAKNFAQSALQWLLDDGVAATIAVTTKWLSGTMMRIDVLITEPSGQPRPFNFAWAWTGIG